MKKVNSKTVYMALVCCFVVASCDNDKTETSSSNKEIMKAQSKTIDNMQSAYKGEKTATAKYEAFAKKAEEEGYHRISILYTAISAAENIHASNHKKVIEDAGSTVPIITPEYKVKNTIENLGGDIEGEAYEAKTMYPDFLKTAEAAENQIAILSLNYARKTEEKHNVFFQQSLLNITNKTLNNLPSKYFVCPDCGNTYATNAPKHCDFSLTDSDKFIVFQ